MRGECLCGKVTVSIPRRPTHINICNCKLCRSVGAAWGYFEQGEVVVDGRTTRFRRADLDPAVLDICFCSTCSCVTHFELNENYEGEGTAVNMRLLLQEELDGIEVRYLDSRHVLNEADKSNRTGHGHIGDGKAF